MNRAGKLSAIMVVTLSLVATGCGGAGSNQSENINEPRSTLLAGLSPPKSLLRIAAPGSVSNGLPEELRPPVSN